MQNKDTGKKGIWSLVLMLVLAVVVVVFSNPLYQWLTGASGGDTYTSVQKGYGGDVTVTLVTDGEEILLLKAEGPGETPGIGASALTSYNEKFHGWKGSSVNSHESDVDLVSGATLTSRAVKKGLADVMSQVQDK